jgi:rubrerythrin
MMTSFDTGEIFELAAQIERDGAEFYRAAARGATGQDKALLERLAQMELGHEQTFTEMQRDLEHIDSHLAKGSDNEESLAYLRAKVRGEVFCNDVSPSALGDMCMEDILKIAIELEKDTIVFYQCIKENIASTETARRIDAIIRQEIGHVLELTKQLEAVKGQ